MRRRSRYDVRVAVVLASLVLSVGPASVRGQTPSVVVIDTNYPQAAVYADDVLLGTAGERVFRLPLGTATIRLVAGGKANWSIPPLTHDLKTGRTDTVGLRLDFPYYYRFESTPFGASVFDGGVNDDLLGQTPLVRSFTDPLTRRIVFALDGYEPREIAPGNDVWNVHSVELRPVEEGERRNGEVALQPPDSRRKWIDYAALGTAAVAGVLAVHYKFKADRRYDVYRDTGDPALRPDIKRYDVYSGVALGVMQGSLGLFAIRLVLK